VNGTVLHLLTPGDGTDALMRVERLRQSGSAPVHVMATLGGHDDARLPVPLKPDLQLPTGIVQFVRNIFRLRRELRDRKATILHSWGPTAHRLAGVTLRRLPDVRWVVSQAPTEWEPSPTWSAVPRARLTGSPADTADYPGLALPTGKVEIPVPPWTEPEVDLPDKSSARKQLGIADDAQVVLCTTALIDTLDMLTSVWACAIVAHIHAQALFLGLGHGPGTQTWLKLISKGLYRERSQYRPRAEDWPAAVAASDVVLHTGLGESVPAPLAMAIRGGLPSVVSGEGPARHMFPAGSISDSAVHRDGRSHAQAIHNILTDAELRRTEGGRSLALAAEWPLRDLNRLYQRLSMSTG